MVGASGCGKTTLLRLVAGFETPDAGTISIGGKQVAAPQRSVAPHRRSVGYVAQDGALFPHLTVGQNIAYGLAGSARSRDVRTASPSYSKPYPWTRLSPRADLINYPVDNNSALHSPGRWRASPI